MPDTKITALAAITTVAPANDLFAIVDVSDNSMAASGTTKNITTNQILGAGGTATIASATISGDLTARNWFVTGGTLPGVGNGNPFAYRIGGGGLGIGAATETGTTAPIVFYCGQGGVEQYRIAPLGVNTWSDGAGGTRMTLNSTGLAITGDLTVRTSGLVVNANGVGIGSATSGSKFYVYDAGAVSAQIASALGGGSNLLLTANATGGEMNMLNGLALLFKTGNTERYRIGNDGTAIWSVGGSTAMTLNSTGLGVGTSPAIKLDVVDAGNTFAARFRGNGGTNFVAIGTTGFGASINGYTAGFAATADLVLQPNGGNVGIGVTPSAINVGRGLEVGAVGNGLWCNNSSYNQFTQNAYNTTASATGWRYAAAASTAAVRVQLGGGEFTVYNATAGTAGNDLTWTQRMNLDASGNLLVGVASSGNRLDIQKSTDCTVLVKSTGANTNIAMDYVSSYGNHTIRKSGTTVWDYGVINDATATPAFKISNASSVGVQLVSGATAWTTLSDETVKDIIEPIGNAVAKVGSLRSVIGKFKTDSEGTRRSFLIAQDVKSVLPEAVDVVGENNELGLRYTEVIPLLVAAIKELAAEVNALKNA